MSGPNPIETPLLLGVRPLVEVGSAQSKSHINPLYGGSVNLWIVLKSSSLTLSWIGRPPWQTITLLLKTYESGRQQKNSEKAS